MSDGEFKPWQMVRQWMRAAPRDNRSLFGQMGRAEVGHGDMMFLEQLLADHQHLTRVVELGTGAGLTTIWLAVAMNFRDGVVHTWDKQRPQPFYFRHWPHGVVYRQGDLYDGPEVELIKQEVSKPDTLLICDGGLKTTEFELYAPHLGPDGVIVVHDWPSEVDHGVVTGIVLELGLRSVLEDWATACISRYRAWEKAK